MKTASYRVQVPLFPFGVEAISFASRSELPATFETGGIAVTHDKVNDRYLAQLEVSATNARHAKEVAIERVNDLLSLLAVGGDGLLVGYGDALTATSLDPQRGSVVDEQIDVDPATGKRHFRIDLGASVAFGSKLSVVKKRNSVEQEAAVLAHREDWAPWFEIALELNHLATTTHHLKPALVLHFTALEVITEGLLGTPPLIFSGEQKATFKSIEPELADLLGNSGLQDEDVARIVTRVRETRRESDIDRMQRALKQLDVGATMDEIRATRNVRGAVVHRGGQSDRAALNAAAANARSWVQASLRTVMEQYV